MIQQVDPNTDPVSDDTDFYQGENQSYDATQSVEPAKPLTTSNVESIPNTDKSIVARKMSLEEAKFKLAQKRAEHDMLMELRREDFRERQITIEHDLNNNTATEHWMKSYWRPAMGWLYMAICAFDFIVGPILSLTMPAVLSSIGVESVSYTPWESLTLSNGGLIHLAFGAILGVTAWTRGQEKISKPS